MTLRQRFGNSLRYIAPIALGLLVSFVGLAPWVAMIRLNAWVRPDIPWAAFATLVWLAVFLAWLNGAGLPARWKAARRYRLRLWRRGSNGFEGGVATTLSLMALIGLLTFVWILLGAPEQPPDLSEYPSTALLVSIVLVTPLVAGVVEEAAYRGYMQRELERFGAGTAIVVSAWSSRWPMACTGWRPCSSSARASSSPDSSTACSPITAARSCPA